MRPVVTDELIVIIWVDNATNKYAYLLKVAQLYLITGWTGNN